MYFTIIEGVVMVEPVMVLYVLGLVGDILAYS